MTYDEKIILYDNCNRLPQWFDPDEGPETASKIEIARAEHYSYSLVVRHWN